MSLPSVGESFVRRLGFTGPTNCSANECGDAPAGACFRCNAAGVFEIVLDNQNLRGAIDGAAFASMPRLSYLSLQNNRVSGVLPSELFRSTVLQFLRLSNNSFFGSLPSIITLPALRDFRVLLNNLSGVLPQSVFDSQFIVRLIAANNAFSGSIPLPSSTIGSLDQLNIAHNRFSGSMSPLLPVRLPNLRFLMLNNNSAVHGTIPSAIGSLPLEILRLDRCSFSGTMPSSLIMLQGLTRLSVSFNQLTGSAAIPSSMQPWTTASCSVTEFADTNCFNNCAVPECCKSVGCVVSVVPSVDIVPNTPMTSEVGSSSSMTAVVFATLRMSLIASSSGAQLSATELLNTSSSSIERRDPSSVVDASTVDDSLVLTIGVSIGVAVVLFAVVAVAVFYATRIRRRRVVAGSAQVDLTRQYDKAPPPRSQSYGESIFSDLS
jgi:hypothetical protein